jgi:hypothetical protein
MPSKFKLDQAEQIEPPVQHMKNEVQQRLNSIIAPQIASGYSITLE